jgi:HYR domain-containing protein
MIPVAMPSSLNFAGNRLSFRHPRGLERSGVGHLRALAIARVAIIEAQPARIAFTTGKGCLMHTKSAWSSLSAVCVSLFAATASASVTVSVDKLDAGDGGNQPPSNVVVADVLVDVSSDDVWTAAGLRGLAMNGAALRYDVALDPNGLPVTILTNPGTGQRFVTFFSKPRGRDADERYTNGAAAAAGQYAPTGPTAVATAAEINVTWFASPPESAASPSVDGAIFRVALDLPAGVTNDQVLLYAGSPPAGATVLFASSVPSGAGTVSATFDVPTPVGLDWGLYLLLSNDSCSSPTMISCGSSTTTVMEDTRSATLDPTDQVLCSGLAEAKTVWFAFTADCARTATIDTVGSSYDTVLGVWTGSCGSLASVDCNDDIDFQAGDLQSRVQFTTVAGTTYLVEVAEFDSDSDGDAGNAAGDLVLNFVCADVTRPTLDCPEQVTVECTGGLTPVTFDATATDACDGSVAVTCVPPSGSTFRRGTTSVTCSATDGSDQTGTCTFDVHVVDTTPPQVNCPEDITGVECTSPAGAIVSYLAGAFDACGIASFDCAPASGATFSIGTTMVTCSVMDAAGNPNSCSFDVTVRDTAPPMITCPSNVVAECTSSAGATVSYGAPTASDVCSTPTVACMPASGSAFGFGSTTVTCTATDAAGLTAMCMFSVTVRDTAPPMITCPAAIVAECTSASGARVTYAAPSTSDVCDGTPTVACSPASGSVFPIATTTVYCTSEDDSHNVGRCRFSVTVHDTVAPIIDCPDPIRAVCSGDPEGTVVEFHVRASDVCDSSPTIQCSPASGDHFPLGPTTVECTARDDSGNTSTCSFRVTIVGSTASSLPTAVVGQPASALVFPLFDSRPGRGTVITVTNTNDSHIICGRSFFTQGDVRLVFTYFGFDESRQFCREFNTSHFLTPGDTLTVIADQDDPEGEIGWLWVEARDPETGEAIEFDHLIGSAIVVDTGLEFLDQYLAYGFRSYASDLYGTTDRCGRAFTDVDGDGQADFDGVEYDFWPQRLLLDQFFQEGDGTQGFANELTLASCDVDPFDDHGTNVSIHPWNNRERRFSVSLNFECFFHAPLSSISGVFGRLLGDLNELVKDGHHLQTGWVEFDADDPILGVFFQRVVGQFFAAGHQIQLAGQFGGACDENLDHRPCALPRAD